ncbi:hypothetical protein ACI78R_18230 [Geodermatophilus sp. SYSU D01106]
MTHHGWPALPRPRAAVVAVALAAAQAAVLLLLVLVVVVDVLGLGRGADVGVPALFAIGACTLAGLDLLGAALLVRGAGRILLLVTAAVEAGLSGLLLVVAATRLATSGVRTGSTADLLVLTALVVLLVMPVVRLVLLNRAEVRTWATDGPGGRPVTPGTLAALLGPVAALAATATVVLAVVGTSPVFTDGSGATYSGTGEPVAPPAPGSPDHDSAFAGLAGDCFEGDMSACDDLYARTPVDDPYETYGSTCGARLDEETYGGCVRVFGLTD